MTRALDTRHALSLSLSLDRSPSLRTFVIPDTSRTLFRPQLLFRLGYHRREGIRNDLLRQATKDERVGAPSVIQRLAPRHTHRYNGRYNAVYC